MFSTFSLASDEDVTFNPSRPTSIRRSIPFMTPPAEREKEKRVHGRKRRERGGVSVGAKWRWSWGGRRNKRGEEGVKAVHKLKVTDLQNNPQRLHHFIDLRHEREGKKKKPEVKGQVSFSPRPDIRRSPHPPPSYLLSPPSSSLPVDDLENICPALHEPVRHSPIGRRRYNG